MKRSANLSDRVTASTVLPNEFRAIRVASHRCTFHLEGKAPYFVLLSLHRVRLAKAYGMHACSVRSLMSMLGTNDRRLTHLQRQQRTRLDLGPVGMLDLHAPLISKPPNGAAPASPKKPVSLTTLIGQG